MLMMVLVAFLCSLNVASSVSGGDVRRGTRFGKRPAPKTRCVLRLAFRTNRYRIGGTAPYTYGTGCILAYLRIRP